MSYSDRYYEHCATGGSQTSSSIDAIAKTLFDRYINKKDLLWDFLKNVSHNGSYLIGYMDNYELDERLSAMAKDAGPDSGAYYQLTSDDRSYFMKVWVSLWTDFGHRMLLEPIVRLQASMRRTTVIRKWIRTLNEHNFAGCGFR